MKFSAHSVIEINVVYMIVRLLTTREDLITYISIIIAHAYCCRFYSWRRYCNKHQIRLGGYAMNRSESPMGADDLDLELEGGNDMVQRGNGAQQHHNATAGPSMSQALAPSAAPSRLDMTAATAAAAAAPHRNRSPTPPRALYRSTMGKGVAFTQEDVTFLVRFMEYRKSQGVLDMVAFWKDVAAKVCYTK